MSKRVFIHYGSGKFDPDRFNQVKNSIWNNKPVGGLWASEENARYGWKDWCFGEEFRLNTFDENFKFKLCDNARILTLKTLDDLNDLPTIASIDSSVYLDFEALAEKYDAIEYYEDFDLFGLRGALYGWDCDSIVILNKDAILPIR